MKISNMFKGLCCSLFLLLSNTAFADWATLDDDLSISQSRARYVRAQAAYIVQIKVTNNGDETVSGPFRVLIENSTLAVKDADGQTDAGVSYFNFLLEEVAPGSSLSVTAKFEYERRARLTFNTHLQSDQPLDTDSDGVIDYVDLCPETVIGEDVNTAGCSLAQLESDSEPSITATSGQSSAVLAIDSNSGSRWESEHGIDNVSLIYGLGREQTITTVQIDWEAANAASYELLASTDGENWVSIETFTGLSFGNRSDNITVNGTYRYLKIVCTERSSAYGYSIFEITVEHGTEPDDGTEPDNATGEVSITATSGASSAALAIDGDSGSRWESEQGIDDVSLTYDLGSEQTITTVQIDWEAANAASYELLASTDGENWVSIETFTGLSFGNRSDNITVNGTYRYLKIVCTERSSAYGYSIFEITVEHGTEPDDGTEQDHLIFHSEKRGIAYGDHSEADLAITQGKIKWWYNWGTEAEPAVVDVYDDYGYDFVPMTWNGDFNEAELRNFLDDHPDVKYLLGFNEPNFGEQANLTPVEAAALWPRLEAIAQDYNLKLVAPAVNFSPGNVDIPGTDDDWDPWKYLDAFFAACEGCQIDYISVHSYMKYAGAFEWYISEFERYNKPIWVTEWAAWDDGGPANMGEQMDYLAETVRWLENNDMVYRYSWFLGRSNQGHEQFPYLDILAEDGSLSPLGSVYTSIPSVNYRYDLPSKIEAEGAHRLFGFKHQPTTDISGLAKITSQTGDFVEYDLNVSTSNEYSIKLRLSSLFENTLVVKLDGEVIYTLDGFSTGAVDLWQTFESDAINFPEGEHILRIEATGSFGFNWLSISAPDSDTDGSDTGAGNGNTDNSTNSDWALVWNDEFDGSNIDLNKWEHEVNCSGGGNNEKQCYTSNSENSFVDNGILKIVAKAESGKALPYSSARLRTKYQGDWKYGRIEVRAKPPHGQGSFPAIWMLPTDEIYGGWPHSGEIDIFESVNLKTVNNEGVEETYIHGNLWYGRSWPNQSNSGAHYKLPDGQNPADGFHTYAIEWEAGEIRWYVDGYLYQSQLKSEVNIDVDGDENGLIHAGWFSDYENEFHWDNAPFNQDFHIMLNFAVGGNWSENVNNLGIDASAFNESNAFEIDYVRVYECPTNPTTGQGCASIRDGYLAPITENGTLVGGEAPTPIKPSNGIATDLIVFDNAINENWPAWSCCDDKASLVVIDDGEHAEVMEFSIGAEPTVVGFNTNVADLPTAYDGSPMLNNGWLEFDLKLVTPAKDANANWILKVEQSGASSEAEIIIARPTAEWQHYKVSLKALNKAGLNLNGIDIIMIFPSWGQGEGAVFRVDNVTILQGDTTGGDSGSGGGDSGTGGDTGSGNNGSVSGEELLSNGSFDNGTDAWIGEVAVNTEGDNTFLQADIETAGDSWDVNVSQVMTLIPDETYVLSFKAKASVARSMIAGLGLISDSWTNVTKDVDLTTEWQTYTYVLTTFGFGDDNSRVFFDLGAEVGSVFIDDVSVSVLVDTGDPVAEDEFFIISSTGASDVSYAADTVGEWSTGTLIDGGITFDSLQAWKLTSQGSWGTVLAFQNGIFGDFSLFNRIELKLATSGGYSGGYKLNISANGISQEITLPVNETTNTWQTISIDTTNIPLNLSSIDGIALYGVGGEAAVSTIHITDFRLVKDEVIAFDSETESDYVFISSDASIASDLIHDGDNNSDIGNIIFGEWSTGTGISSANYLGLDAIVLTDGGSWGAVFALQGDISDGTTIDNYDVDMAKYTNIKFKISSQGAFESYVLFINSKVGGNEASQEVTFTLANPAQWNDIDIDLAQYGVNLSNVNQVVLYGIYDGGSAGQKIYLTDMVLYDSGYISAKDSSDDKFVFFSSTGESSDMIFDGDNFAYNGNVTLSEWSTGTQFTADVSYNGLNAFELNKGDSWGAVLALMGDIYGDVQEYKLDVAKYETINFKIAAQGTFSEYVINFLVNGAEFQVPLTVYSNWTEVNINVVDIPLNMSKLTQIAIYGVGGAAGDKIYITDLNISK
ncbi:MAG: glycosyl hydrolase [Colwellia sp.]